LRLSSFGSGAASPPWGALLLTGAAVYGIALVDVRLGLPRSARGIDDAAVMVAPLLVYTVDFVRVERV